MVFAKTTQKITTDTLAKDAMFARNILDTEKDAGKLSSYATNWQRVGARTNNSMLCDLATEAHRRGRAYKFDAVMPAAANDSKIERLAPLPQIHFFKNLLCLWAKTVAKRSESDCNQLGIIPSVITTTQASKNTEKNPEKNRRSGSLRGGDSRSIRIR